MSNLNIGRDLTTKVLFVLLLTAKKRRLPQEKILALMSGARYMLANCRAPDNQHGIFLGHVVLTALTPFKNADSDIWDVIMGAHYNFKPDDIDIVVPQEFQEWLETIPKWKEITKSAP